MEEIEFGKIEYIEKIGSELSLDIVDLAKKYFKQADFAISDTQFLDYNEDYGFVLKSKHNSEELYVGFSDHFVSIDSDSKIDPIWINIIAKKLNRIDPLSKQEYLKECYELLNLIKENIEDFGVSTEDLTNLNDCLLTIELNNFNPNKQVLSEKEKLITYLAIDE